MKIEALETIKHHPIYMESGDVKTVDDESGQICVDNGWAKNVETGEIGDREGGPVTLNVDKAEHGVTNSEI